MASGMEKLGVKSDNEVIKENEKWFEFYLILPTISAAIVAVACFVFGMVFAVVGVGWATAVFWVGCPLFAYFSYIISKIILSYSILQILYLRKIINNTPESIDNKKEKQNETLENKYISDENEHVDEDENVNIAKKDECPSCFHKINSNEIECSYCGYKLK